MFDKFDPTLFGKFSGSMLKWARQANIAKIWAMISSRITKTWYFILHFKICPLFSINHLFELRLH